MAHIEKRQREAGRSVDIDVSSVRTAQELHDLLRSALGFPDYYGNNWDAFNECISDLAIDLPKQVRVRGMTSLSRRLPREAALFRQCGDYPEAIPSFEWLS